MNNFLYFLFYSTYKRRSEVFNNRKDDLIMANINWIEVEQSYQKSIFDWEKLYLYAKTAAASLQKNYIPYDGYTDEEASIMKKGIGKLFPEMLNQRIDYHHLGFWILATSGTSSHHTDRKKTRYRNWEGKMSSFQMYYSNSKNCTWVLLSNGQLACCQHSYIQYTEDKKIWNIMTHEDIMLLDHKSRSIDRSYNDKSGRGGKYGTDISSSNYLLTGKKGGGCSKKITELLKKHNLYTETKKTNSNPDKPQLPISKSYTLTTEQLKNGCSIQHAFTNGTTTSVRINANTRSGKVITVRTKQSNGAEAIRLLER